MITQVNKEQLGQQRFCRSLVWNSVELLSAIRRDLQKAMILGNTERVKARIFFQTEDGVKAVETTVWAVTDTGVSLKGGAFIPMQSIFRISI